MNRQVLEAEFVGGPRCGERTRMKEALPTLRIEVSNGHGKPRTTVVYRRRGFQPLGGYYEPSLIFYDYAPAEAA